MKKIVISTLLMGLLAVAQAQTISGAVNYDFTKAQGAAVTTGLADSQINLTATENIGNGIKVTAGLGFNGAARGATFTGNDAFVKLDTTIGSVTAGQVEVANGLKANSFGLAPVIGADGVVLGAAANKNLLKYETPSIGGFSASVSATRDIGTTQDQTYVVGLQGKLGAFNTSVDYTDGTNRVRAGASTTLAGVTVGAGWSGNETGVANSWAVGGSVPFGPLTIGAAYSDGNGHATEVGAQYNLSKRTNVQVAYRDVRDNSVAGLNIGTTRVRLSHSF